jgi:predicted restriction endonuclease
MKVTKYSTYCVETQTDSVHFVLIIKSFRLDVLIENKRYAGIADLWSSSGAKVYKSAFLGDTTEEILKNWSSDKWGRPDFKAINALVRFWETLEEKENKMKTKQRL